MTISANYPSIRPSLLLDFANGQALDSRINFTRAGTGTYYDGETSVVAEQNLLLQSQFASSWTAQGASLTLNSTTDPNGGSSGTTLTSTTSASTPTGCYQSTSTQLGQTFSVFAKAGTASFVGITLNTNNGPWANFNVSTGAVASSSGCTASIVSVGGGWYRCILANVTAAVAGFAIIAVRDADPSNNAWANGTCASGNYIYIWGAQLENRSAAAAYTATTAAITNYIPQLLTAVANQPRFDFNPTTRQSLGLLMEQSSVNLLTYSEQFDNAAWTKSNSTITANANVAPDGTLTADKIVAGTGTGTQAGFVAAAAISTSAIPYTITLYVKYAELQYFQIWAGGSAWSGNANFDLVGNTVTVQNGCTATMQSVGNNWFRLSVAFTASAATIQPWFSFVSTSTAARASTYTGNGFNGLYIWGAQLEALAFPTSYIPTVASTVTRAADAASITGTNFSSWYNNAEGTIYSEGVAPTSGFFCLYAITDAIGTNTISNYYNTSDYMFYVRNDQGVQAQPDAGTLVTGFNKFSGAYKTNDFAISLNGVTVATDTSGAVPVVNRLLIGSASGQQSLNGTIKKIAYYPIRVTNANLQALTGS